MSALESIDPTPGSELLLDDKRRLLIDVASLLLVASDAHIAQIEPDDFTYLILPKKENPSVVVRYSEDTTRQYLDTIGIFELLTKDEEVTLAKAYELGRVARLKAQQLTADGQPVPTKLNMIIRNGDQARHTFINTNTRLVVSIAKKRPLKPGVDLLDVIGIGNEGLEHAVDKFDWRKGFKFSTYATSWIRQFISRGLPRISNSIHIPDHTYSDMQQALRESEDNGTALPANVANLFKLASTVSLQTPIGNDNGGELGDFLTSKELEPDDHTMSEAGLELLVELIDDAFQDPRLQIVKKALILRYCVKDDEGNQLTLQEVGDALGYTRERARQLGVKGIAMLQKHCKDNNINFHDFF